jgi:hypothetical protein
MTVWSAEVRFVGESTLSAKAPGRVFANAFFTGSASFNQKFSGPLRSIVAFVGASTFSINGAILVAGAGTAIVGVPGKFSDVLDRLLNNLAATVSSRVIVEGAAVRRQIGIIRATYATLLDNKTFATALLTCFNGAHSAKVNLNSLGRIREALFIEVPQSYAASALIQLAIGYCLSAEARLITEMTFTSRDDVAVMMAKMKLAFDTARDMAADAQDSASYQALTFLAGALTNHLATAARPLPRMVTFNLQSTLPALSLSQRLYYQGDRSDELVAENHTVHPAFCQREIVGLNK